MKITPRKIYLSLFALLILIFFLIPFGHIRLYLNGCFNVNDFGIYQQAIYNSISQFELNPYISVRGVKIFNDHFDPVTLIAGFIPLIFGHSGIPIIIFQFSLYICGFYFLFRYFKKNEQDYLNYFILACSLTLLSRGFLNGALDALRPMLWAFPLAIFLPLLIKRKNYTQTLILIFLLCLFKEIYLFFFFGLSLITLKEKNFKFSLISFFLGVFYYLLISKFRPMFLGPVIDYSNNFVGRLIENPVQLVFESVKNFVPPYKSLIPLLILLIFTFKKSIKDRNNIIDCFLLLLPAYIIHVLAGRLVFHQVTPFIYSMLGFLFFSDFPKLFFKEKLKIQFMILFPLIFTSTSRLQKFIDHAFKKNPNSCIISIEKRKELDSLKEILRKVPKESKVLATNDLITYVNSKGLKIYQMYPTTFAKKKYDYLVTSKFIHSDIYPLTTEQYNKFISSCTKTTSIIFDGTFYQVRKGDITKDCMKVDIWAKEGDPLTTKDVESI